MAVGPEMRDTELTFSMTQDDFFRVQELESVSVHPVYDNPRTGLLRTFWEPDRVLRSPLRSLCVQGVLSCPTRRAFLCTLYTETPERAF